MSKPPTTTQANQITTLYQYNVTAREIALTLKIPYPIITSFCRVLKLQNIPQLSPGQLGELLLELKTIRTADSKPFGETDKDRRIKSERRELTPEHTAQEKKCYCHKLSLGDLCNVCIAERPQAQSHYGRL